MPEESAPGDITKTVQGSGNNKQTKRTRARAQQRLRQRQGPNAAVTSASKKDDPFPIFKDDTVAFTSGSSSTINPTGAHTASSTSAVPTPSPTTGTRTARKQPCRYWKSGTCARGDKCWFVHDPAVLENVKREGETSGVDGGQCVAEIRQRLEVQHTAKLVQEEAIRKAREAEDDERRKHEVERREMRAKQDTERKEREASFQYQHNALQYSLVTYSAGIAVNRVIPGFDLALVTVKNLPGNATSHEVKELFTQEGIHSDDVFVAELKHAGPSKRANVYARSYEAGAIAQLLEGTELRGNTLQFDVKESASEEAMGSTAPGAPILTISWFLPSVSFLVEYESAEEAQEIIRTLDKMLYKGRRIKAQMLFETSWMTELKIMGFSPGTSTEEVTALVHSTGVTQLSTNDYDVQQSITRCRQDLNTLLSHGLQPTEFNVISENNRGKVMVKASFATWDEAKRAHDWMRPRFRKYHVFLPKELQYSVRVWRQQYQAQKGRWDALKSGGNTASSLEIYDDNKGYDRVLIKVVGNDKKAVGALKLRVEHLAAGEKLGPAYWNPSFTTLTGRRFTDLIFEETGVFIRSDWKQQTLKLFSDKPIAVENARKMIKDEITRLESLELTIRLDLISRQSFTFLMRQGMDILKDAIGEENLTLDLASTPQKLVVRGDQDAKDHANRIIKQSFDAYKIIQPVNNGANMDTCPVCYDEVRHPEQLVCGHIYCTSCIRRYIMSDSDKFPLVCIGAEATCNRPIPIPVIQRLLPNHPRFIQLLDKAFKAYIDRHPDELKYCPTPDCEQIYRRNTMRQMELQCPSCFVVVCSACNEEPHTGMTCEENRINRDPSEQERLNNEWAEANGVKRCPRCQVLVQKIEGCNHMQCNCGAHFCWVCNGVFDAGLIYQHMSEQHGGFYGDAPAPRANVNPAQRQGPAPLPVPRANPYQAQRQPAPAVPAPAPLPLIFQDPLFILEQAQELQRIQQQRVAQRQQPPQLNRVSQQPARRQQQPLLNRPPQLPARPVQVPRTVEFPDPGRSVRPPPILLRTHYEHPDMEAERRDVARAQERLRAAQREQENSCGSWCIVM